MRRCRGRTLAERGREQLAAGVPLGGRIYTTGRDGLRVLATGPEFPRGQPIIEVESFLAHAREAHALTVIDCGTLTRPAAQAAATAGRHTSRGW